MPVTSRVGRYYWSNGGYIKTRLLMSFKPVRNYTLTMSSMLLQRAFVKEIMRWLVVRERI